MPSTFSDYSPGGSPNAVGTGAAGSDNATTGYWSLGKLKRAFTDYLGSKGQEIEEQKDARRYYHASQWTADQIKVLKLRQQPPTVFNRFARKVDGVVGLLERLRQDPKAFPRTPQHEEGAELATATVRYVLDEQRWKEKSPECARDGAIDGIGGIEIIIEAGDQGDPEIGFEIVEPDCFFYDPRSYRADFSDAGFNGIAKWLDLDIAKEMFPDKADELEASDAAEFSTGSDRENRWFSSDGVSQRVRVVDCWYKHKGEWCWAIFTGSTKLMEGRSYLKDEKGRTICKYIMFSANVDQDGDRYGFHRNMKSAQDAINARQSKLQHILASKRLIVRNGGVQDVETTRREWAKPDGVVVVNGIVGENVKADDQSFDFAGWTKMMELAYGEIESFGPNAELVGEESGAQSGRAIQLKQNAGMAQLGPYILAYRGWKLRVYRAIWNAVQQHWTAERWIRVTDDEGLAQFIQVNGLGIDPKTGMPAIINQLGALDVDIIMDEGGDHVNMMGDLFDALQQILPAVAPMMPPSMAMAAVNSLIQASPLDASTKKQFKEAANQPPDPMMQQAKQAELAGAVAKVQETNASAQLKQAQAVKAISDANQPQPGQPQQQEYEIPAHLQDMQAAADIEETQASAEQKRAQAFKAHQDAMLAPHQMHFDQMNADADRKIAQQRAQ